MSEITGTSVGHEEYSFACGRCGYGWEQAYDIEHRLDADGHEAIVYRTAGVRVHSPLSDLVCPNCERRGAVRILRSGQVSTAVRMITEVGHPPLGLMSEPAPPPARAETPTPAPERTGEPPGPVQEHHRHLSDLLHPFRDRT